MPKKLTNCIYKKKQICPKKCDQNHNLKLDVFSRQFHEKGKSLETKKQQTSEYNRQNNKVTKIVTQKTHVTIFVALTRRLEKTVFSSAKSKTFRGIHLFVLQPSLLLCFPVGVKKEKNYSDPQ